MSMREAKRQMPEKSGRLPEVGGEAARASTSDEATRPRHETESTGSALLLAALTRENLQQAWKRVKANKGAAGVDSRGIPETARYLQTAWPEIRAQLVQGTYRPSPVRRVGGLSKRVEPQPLFNEKRESIDAFAAIHRFPVQEDLQPGIDSEHGRVESRRRTCANCSAGNADHSSRTPLGSRATSAGGMIGGRWALTGTTGINGAGAADRCGKSPANN